LWVIGMHIGASMHVRGLIVNIVSMNFILQIAKERKFNSFVRECGI